MKMAEDETKVHLDSLPMSFTDLSTNKEDKYLLLGVVRFISGELENQWLNNKTNQNFQRNRKNKIEFEIGHYTAVCKRHNNWYEIHDANGTERHLNIK